MVDSFAPTIQVKTLLFTDIEGSTAHWEHDSDVMAATVGRHDDLVRSAVETAGGDFVQHRGEGDSTFSVFDDPAAAVGAALNLQLAILSERWLTREPVRVRIGIHTGEVELRDGDYHGRAINRAARVRGLAEGSTIVLSAASAALASECLPRGATLVDLGEHRLRGLAGLENLLAVRHADLPDPGLALRYLERRAAPPVPAALRLHGETPLVGRERELTSLRQAWTDAAGGRATLTLLAGEPGVGKTRLTAALAEHAAADGALVLCGRCDEEALQPYQPVAEAFGGALDRLSGSEVAAIVGDEAADLSLVLPELRARIPVRGEPTPERVVLFQAAAKLLARLAADRPVLIVLDDLHWADEPTLALLRHALRTQSEATVMVVTTYRDTDLDASRSLLKWMVQLRREVTTVDIDVPGLERVDVSRLLGPEHADDLDTVWNMTDGNPFFVIELRRSLQEGTRSALPRSVRQSVSERVDRLPPVSREFVFAAAIAGVDVDVAVAARAARTATDAADDAVGHGILVEVPDEPNRLLFGHGLVRSAVLDGLSPDRRAGWHGRVAAAIEDVHIETIDEHASRLAHHHRESGDERPDGPAYRWSMRAGRRAGRMLAYEEAEDQYREAAGIAGRGGDEARRITAELELAEILVRSGRPTTGHEIANAAAVAAAEIGASDLAGWAVFNTRFAQALGLPGNLDAIRAARSALSPDSPWRGPVDVVFAGELMQAGEVEAGIELLRTATDRAQLAGDWATLAFALTGSHTYIDRLDVPVDDILAAIAKADDNDAPSFRLSPEVLRVQSEGFRIGELIAEGNIRSARSAAREFAARYGGETGTVEVSVPLFSLVDAMLRGRWSEYQEQRDRFREDPELAIGFESQLLCIDAMEAWLKGRLGDLVEVIEALPPTLMFVRPGLAIALAEARRPDDARCVIAECAANGGLEARSRTVFGRAELAMLALAAVGIGDVEAAARLYELLAPRRGQVAAWGAWAIWGAVDGMLGSLALVCGRPDHAVEHLQDALRLHDAAGWRALSAGTATDLAAALLARARPGDHQAAVRLAEDAGAAARELELAGVARRLAALILTDDFTLRTELPPRTRPAGQAD